MVSTYRDSRDDQDDSNHAELLLELNKSVSRLRALSSMEYAESSDIKGRGSLEHTLDAILNLAQKSTMDETTNFDSLRVARPVQRRPKRENTKFCGLKLLLCGMSDKKEEEDCVLQYPAFSSLKSSKLGSRSKESFWREERPREFSSTKRPIMPDKTPSTSSTLSTTHSKKDLVLDLGRINADDVSSLSTERFSTNSYQYNKDPVPVSSSPASVQGGQCMGPDSEFLGCSRGHREGTGGHFSFLDLILRKNSSHDRSQRDQDDGSSFLDDNDVDMKIVGFKDHLDCESSSGCDQPKKHTKRSSLKSSRKVSPEMGEKTISRVEAEYSPRHLAERTTSEKATIYIYNQSQR